MPGVTPHPGSLPSGCIPAGRLTDPARGPDGPPARGAEWAIDCSAPFWSSAAAVPRPRGHDQARFPRPIPWRSSSAFTRRTFTAPSSRGTTSRPAWPASSPGNCSSVRHGLGSPGWASVCGAGHGPHVATFAHGRRAGQRDWRARFPVIRTADLAPDLGAGPRARRGDRRGARRREGVGLSTPVRAPLTAGWHASNPERRLATSRGLTVRSPRPAAAVIAARGGVPRPGVSGGSRPTGRAGEATRTGVSTALPEKTSGTGSAARLREPDGRGTWAGQVLRDDLVEECFSEPDRAVPQRGLVRLITQLSAWYHLVLAGGAVDAPGVRRLSGLSQ